MSPSPSALMLLTATPQRPAATSGLIWVSVEDGHWAVCREADHQLVSSRQEIQRSARDVPLVELEWVSPNQRAGWAAEGHLWRCSLPVSGFRTAPPAPQAWALALEVVAQLEPCIGWSTSEPAWQRCLEGAEPPRHRAHDTRIFSDRCLARLGLTTLDLDPIATGGSVYRLSRLGSHWLIQSPYGLGNGFIALQQDQGGRLMMDQALESALQMVAARHLDAVQAWLDTQRVPEPGSLTAGI